MSYTTLQDLQDAAGGAARFLQLADLDGDGVIDAVSMATAQAAADGVVDTYLRKFNAADLAALRAAPTATIKRLAARLAIFWYLETKRTNTKEDNELRAQWIDELKGYRADELRVSDTKTPRARIVESDSDVSRDKLKGQW